MKTKKRGRTVIADGYAEAKDGSPLGSVEALLTEEAKCGCGINCCYGYLTLPNWDSTTGDRADRFALYIVDGAVKIDTIDNAKLEIEGYKNM